MLFRDLIVPRSEIIRSYATPKEVPAKTQLVVKNDSELGGNLDGLIKLKPKPFAKTQQQTSMIPMKPKFNTMQKRSNQIKEIFIPATPTFDSVPDRRFGPTDDDVETRKAQFVSLA